MFGVASAPPLHDRSADGLARGRSRPRFPPSASAHEIVTALTLRLRCVAVLLVRIGLHVVLRDIQASAPPLAMSPRQFARNRQSNQINTGFAGRQNLRNSRQCAGWKL